MMLLKDKLIPVGQSLLHLSILSKEGSSSSTLVVLVLCNFVSCFIALYYCKYNEWRIQ